MGLKVGTTRYTAKDVEIRARVAEVLGRPTTGQELLDRLFGGTTHGWVFGEETILFKALDLLARSGKDELPNEVAPFRRAVGGEQTRQSKVTASDGLATLFAPRSSRAVKLDLVRRDPVAGKVWVGQDLYGSPKELQAGPPLATLAALADLFTGPAVPTLAADTFSEWEFADWKTLRSVVTGWNGKLPYPYEFRPYRRPRRPKSVLTEYDPTARLDKTTTALREKQYSYAWATCGNTVEFLTARIDDLGGYVCLENEVVVAGASGGEQLKRILTAPVEVLVLINIINPLIHEFVIEKRPEDQTAVLQQGYLSAYYATWWARLEESRISLDSVARAKVEDMRDQYGGEQPIDLAAFADKLAAFLLAPTIGSDAAYKAWQTLPFHPLGRPNSGETPSFTVRVWSVNEPEVVRLTVADRFPGANAVRLTQVIMYEAIDFSARIKRADTT